MTSDEQQGGYQKISVLGDVDVEATWAGLEEHLKEVYLNLGAISRAKFMDIYTRVCDYGHPMPQNSAVTTEGEIFPPADMTLYHDLYERLKELIQDYLENLLWEGADLMDEDYIAFYLRAWAKFKFSSRVLDRICSYLNRHWVQRMRSAGQTQFVEIYYLALLSWRDFLVPFRKKAANAVLKLIEKERVGESVDTKLLGNVLSSFLELGVDEKDPKAQEPLLSVYKDTFECVFLEETARFYSRASTVYLQQRSITKYMMAAQRCINEEERRVRSYMHGSTVKPLIELCDKVLIEAHVDELSVEFANLLRDFKEADLKRMYGFVSRVPSVLVSLQALFERHVWEQGLLAIERLGDEAVKNPKLYVTTIFQEHRKFKGLVLSAFAGDERFAYALRKSCEKFVNSNAATRPPNTSRKSPELLAKYCSSLLTKTSQHPDVPDLEDALNQALAVFVFIEDKDAFEKFYYRRLSTRLVQKASVSDEAEASMISKLREVCGFEYTAKLQRMFTDVALSKGLNERFSQHMAESGESIKLDFNVLVLTSGTWPFQASSALSIPQPLEPCLQHFSVFYYAQRSNRTLTWLYNISTGELAAYCFKSVCTLHASTFQMAVLLGYNNGLSFTVQELQQATSMDMETLQCVLRTLIGCGLLTCPVDEDNTSIQAGAALPPDAAVVLREDYESPRQRVNINVTLKTDKQVEQDATDRTILEDRKYCVQAAIVRIMKTRQKLNLEEIVAEVLGQLSSRFKPEVSTIKDCVDILVKKGYLDKEDGDAVAYSYSVE